MKNRVLRLQAVFFTVSCYCLTLVFVWAVRFPAFRMLFSITVALVCLVAEVYSGYVVVRQMWKWCGAGVRLFLKEVPETAAAPVLTEQAK
jgi:hypothetical protein